ncbi:MAG: SDR family NAD(P)-dependent oxidoreductase [Gammaproteobacteria bacterium]|nr:SDR family NAD(P)-dependent oxidoreductase [Gammaproteobacteria bacterium]
MKNYFDLSGKTAHVCGDKGNLGPIWIDALVDCKATVYGYGMPQSDLTIKSEREKIRELFPIPDILILNQAIDNPPGSDASFFGNYEKILEVNLISHIKMVELFIDDMHLHAEWDGRKYNIVIIGSMLGFIASDPRIYPDGFDKPVAYGNSKAALWNFVCNLNMRYAKYGIVTNMLALSAVEGNQAEDFKKVYNERIPIGRMLRREDFEKEFLTCCTATVPYGEPVLVDGGYTIW